MTIATKFWTYTQLKTKVINDLDLENEVFVQSDEMLGYANEAIDAAEQIIHGLYEDYFLDKANITLVNGTSEYVLPSTIYAQKIRGVMYRNGTRAYEVKRVRDWKKFIQYTLDLINAATNAVEYMYFIMNQTAGSPKILFTPAVIESGTYITVWFMRQAAQLVNDSDVMDIPEAANYVLQYMKVRCMEKEGNPLLSKAVADLAREQSNLEGTLSAMVPDANNEVEMDLTHYEESV